MVNSLYSLAEQSRIILGKGDMQSIIASVIDGYASIAKRSWYENRAEGVSEIDGVFLVPFKNITPILDLSTDMYYIVNPSSYLLLPNGLGINYVGFSKGQTKPFVQIPSAGVGLWSNLKAYALGGSQTYFVEGIRTYFPKMTNTTNGQIMMRYAIAFDQMDVEQDLQIPPNIANEIIDIVVAKFSPKPPVVPEKLN